MYIIGYFFIAILSIALIIWFLWGLESYIPSFQKLKNKTDNSIYISIKEWLLLLSKKRKFNGIIYFEEDKEVIDLKMGYKSQLKDELINDNTSFRLASVSKNFTAFGIMLLKKEKKINYDTPLNDVIKNFPSQKVTIRHLLNHTSSITVDYIKLAKKNKYSKNYILSISDATTLICNNTKEESINPLSFYLYNNSNYILLARVIELISKLSFEEFMYEKVFKKLDLKDTFVWNLLSKTDLTKKVNVAMGFEAYLKSKPIFIKPTWIDGVAGDGAIFSSLSDLKKWSQIWNGNKLLNKSDLQEAFKRPLLSDGTYSNYGFGWVIGDDFVWHNGKWLANNSLLIKSLKKSKYLIVIDNSTNIRFDKITKTLTQTLFSKNEQ